MCKERTVKTDLSLYAILSTFDVYCEYSYTLCGLVLVQILNGAYYFLCFRLYQPSV